MNVVSRGVRNAFRNNIRTGSIVLILGVSIGLALAMVVARQAVEDKITSVKSSIGNTVTISPAGVRGFEGGGNLLTDAQLTKVKQIPHVSTITSVLNDRLTIQTSNLVSAVDAGSFGARNSNNSGQQVQIQSTGRARGGENSTLTRTFSPPVMVTGVNNANIAQLIGATSLKYTSGAAIDFSGSENSAVIGSALATKNSLSVGSTFKMYNQDITVKGIYDAGNTFANAGLVMPITAVQNLSSQAGQISSAIVTVDSIENSDSTLSAVQSSLGSAADVTSSKDAVATAIAPLQSVKTISVYSLLGALGAGSLIILLTMVMIVRERRREVGILKAIGGGTLSVMSQFIVEAVTLCILAGIVGVGIGFATSAPVTKALVTNASSSQQSSTQSQQGGPGGPGGGGRLFRAGYRGISISNVEAPVGWNILGYGLGAIVVIAILGSAVPAWLITKIRPAEVMRVE